jgi:HEAT repeat protein
MRLALAETTAPRLVNKLVRISSDVGLADLVPQFILFADSKSSLIRTAVARAIGVLATPESGEATLLRLKDDPIAEVKAAAEAGLKDLRAPAVEEVPEAPAADEPSLDPTAMSALQELMQTMQGEEA